MGRKGKKGIVEKVKKQTVFKEGNATRKPGKSK